MIAFFRNRQFQFSAETTILVILAAVLCYSMGYWQLTRFHEKNAYFAILEEQNERGPAPLDPTLTDFSALYHGQVTVSGTFDHQHQVVLINRSHRDQPGVKVITPLLPADGGPAVLVDRGFLPFAYTMDESRRSEYQPEGRMAFTARLRPAQAKSFFLTPETADPTPGQWKGRWLRIEVEKMAMQLPYPVLPIYLEQETAPVDGEFPLPITHAVLPASRHLNYTLQWFSFGTFGLFIGALVQFRRKPAVAQSSQMRVS
ncbi:SURF1 family protein [Acanthopleuribacter pedis]|uniref:SURF1-like protein n=1 Tax=Acanthopleuribacter pedis TaxID=442870 RepID=A0A8J7QKF6_9BACT|nr:SURF1 family protein [Acanthopleuribacter pedis]MBO1322646.1 SURF1 family protein [Acanthopleuribacter pedis]